MMARVGALPPTYQHDRSESGTTVNCLLPGGSMPLFSFKRAFDTREAGPRHQRVATAGSHPGTRRERIAPVTAAGTTDPLFPLLRLRR